MGSLQNFVYRIESALHELDTGVLDQRKVRRIIKDSLQNLAQIPPDPSLSLADTFKEIAQGSSDSLDKEIGLVSIRLCCSKILSSASLQECRPYIVQLIGKSCSELTAKIWVNKNSQSYEKLEQVIQIHRDACHRLENLQKPFTSLQDLSDRRNMIMKALNYGPTKFYLSAFGFDSVLLSVTSLLAFVDRVTKSQGYELQTSIRELQEKITDDLIQYANVETFIVREYLLPLLRQAQTAAKKLQDTLSEKFACEIVVPPSPYKPEKKYPLHILDSKIQIFVPLTNKGSGVAQNVLAHCVANHCNVQDEIILGNLNPGSSILTLDIIVTKPRKSIDLEVEIQWDVVGDNSSHTQDLSVTIQGQRADLDWDNLSLQTPYTLEVAYDKEFHGREDALRRILLRLAPKLMQSCYIIGQKRVGKSSLAHAVETRIRNNIYPGDYYTIYLECGEIIHSTGERTLQELGRRLEEFLAARLPHSTDWVSKEYSSSLLPLNRLLEQLRTQKPESRFVVIFDEFDEINESLYRVGELANTFFLNLRTLSSKKNIAFILIGAERMPYVMESQGEKLNKFERESLDSFNQKTEWADYRALVETPIKGVMKLHEPALYKLFDLTNGHPYFTKMLCTKVYEYAVESKDAEVSNAEIEKAAERLITTVDINAFAHYWRDGIHGSTEDIEIVSLQRRYLFMAWARTARSGNSLTSESIEAHVHTSRLNSGEVLPLLENLCKRGVFREHNGGIYKPTVELFGTWLQEGGFSELVSDRLGDELAEAKQKREDKAYVQSKEIVQLAEKWECYQGQKITEEKIRAWIEQVKPHVEQRLLFKLLQNIRFFGELEAKEKFSQAHKWICHKLPTFVKSRRAQRRNDILVSHCDGPGKSGEYYAALYASANDILRKNLIALCDLEKKLGQIGNSKEIGLVIVDDMIGTGTNLVEKLSDLSDLFQQTNVGTNIPLSVVALCGTVEGERRVRKHLEKSLPNADLEVCEILESRHFAFGNTIGFWETEDEIDEAKALLTHLGTRVQRQRPLGFGKQGLLLTFSRNCPNNSLPILHGYSRGEHQWEPLFPRIKA